MWGRVGPGGCHAAPDACSHSPGPPEESPAFRPGRNPMPRETWQKLRVLPGAVGCEPETPAGDGWSPRPSGRGVVNLVVSRRGTGRPGPHTDPNPSLTASPGRLAQRESASLTRKRPQVQILYRPPGKTPSLALENQVLGPTVCRASGAVSPPGEPPRREASTEPSQTRRPPGARSPGVSSISAPSGSNVPAVFLDVQTANGLVDGLEDERPVLGEEVTVNVLGRLDLAVPHLIRHLHVGRA